MEILYVNKNNDKSKIIRFQQSIKLFISRFGLIYTFEGVQSTILSTIFLCLFFIQLFYYVDLKNQDSDIFNRILNDIVKNMNILNLELKVNVCTLNDINVAIFVIFIINTFFFLGQIIISALFQHKTFYGKLFKNKNKKLQIFLFFNWINREINCYLLFSLHISNLLNIFRCEKEFDSDILDSKKWKYILNVFSIMSNFLALISNIFFDSLFNIVRLDKSQGSKKFSYLIINMLRISFSVLIYIYQNAGEEQIFSKKSIRLLIFLVFAIVFIVSFFVQTFVLPKQQFFFQNMLFSITFVSFISFINCYLEEQNLLLFTIVIILIIVYANRIMHTQFYIKKLDSLQKSIQNYHHIQQKQQCIDKFLRNVYMLQMYFGLDSYCMQQIKELCYRQFTMDQECFSQLIKNDYEDQSFLKQYFICNHKFYNYAHISAVQKSFQQLLFQVHYDITIFKNYQLAYIRLVQYLQKSPSFSQINNILTLMYTIKNKMDIIEIKKLQEYSSITKKVLDIYKLSQKYTQSTYNFVAKFQQIWLESVQYNKSIKNLQQKLQNSVKLKSEQQKSFNKIWNKTQKNLRIIYLQGLYHLLILKDKGEFQKLFGLLKEQLKTLIKDSNHIFTFQQKFGLNSNSTIVEASGNFSDLGQIKNLYYNYKEFLGYEKSELIDQNVNVIIPKIVAQKHDFILMQFLKTCKGKFINKDRLVFIVHQNSYIRPVQIFLKMGVDQMYGLRFYLYTNIEAPIIRQKYFNKNFIDSNLIYYLIFNEKKEISDCSSNLQNIFKDKNTLSILRNRKQGEKTVYINDLFPELEDVKSKKDSFYNQELVFMHLNLEFFKTKVDKLKNQQTLQTLTEPHNSQNSQASLDTFQNSNFIQTQIQLIQKETYFDGNLQIHYVMFVVNENIQNDQKETLITQKQYQNQEIYQEKFKQKLTQIQKRDEHDQEQDKDDFYEQQKTKFLKNQKRKFSFAIKFLLLIMFLFQILTTNVAFYIIKIYNKRYIENVNDFYQINGQIVYNLVFQTETLNQIYYGSFYQQDIQQYSTYLQNKLDKFSLYKQELDKLTESFIKLLYNQYDQYRIQSEVIKQWKIVYLEDNQILSYEANLIVSLETINNKVFTISQSPLASFYFNDMQKPQQQVPINYLQQNKINFMYLWTNIFYEYALSYAKLKKEFYNYTLRYMQQQKTIVSSLFALAIILTSFLLFVLFILFQKVQNISKNIALQFLNVPEKKSQKILQNCQNFLHTLDFVDKYNINNFDVNDYIYLQDNLEIKDKIEVFSQKKTKKVQRKKTSLHLPQNRLDFEKMQKQKNIKKYGLLKIACFFFIAPIFFIFQVCFQMFVQRKEQYLGLLDQLNEYKKTTLVNFFVNYHDIINDELKVKEDLLQFYQDQMQKANSRHENFKSQIELQDYHFHKFWNNFELIQNNLCDFAQKNFNKQDVPQECEVQDKQNLYHQGMEFVVITLFNNSVKNSKIDKKNFDKQAYVNEIKPYEKLIKFLSNCKEYLFENLTEAFNDKMKFYFKLKQIFFIIENFLILVFTTIGIINIMSKFRAVKNFNEHLIDLIPKNRIKILLKQQLKLY